MEGALAGVTNGLKGVSNIDPGAKAYLAGDKRAVPETLAGCWLMAQHADLTGAVNAARGGVAAAEGNIYAQMGRKTGMTGGLNAAKGAERTAFGNIKVAYEHVRRHQDVAVMSGLLQNLGMVNVIVGVALILGGAGLFLVSRRMASA